MSKVPYTIDAERYICDELHDLREMHKCRDFSGMLAAVERIQRHVNAMESALYSDKYRVFHSNVMRNYKSKNKKELVECIEKEDKKVNKDK